VLEVLFCDGPPASSTFAFVNITRSFLVDDRPLPAHAGRLVLEVVESVEADDAVLAGLERLRSRGYRIAIDDFAAEPDQVAMMPWADYVKVDCRDVQRLGELAADHVFALPADMRGEHGEPGDADLEGHLAPRARQQCNLESGGRHVGQPRHPPGVHALAHFAH